MQDTSIIGAESHPMHLHGFNFFVVGQGFGNYNPAKDPAGFNLVDPVERNTVGVPPGGWLAIRFLADNPGLLILLNLIFFSYSQLNLNLDGSFYFLNLKLSI